MFQKNFIEQKRIQEVSKNFYRQFFRKLFFYWMLEIYQGLIQNGYEQNPFLHIKKKVLYIHKSSEAL